MRSDRTDRPYWFMDGKHPSAFYYMDADQRMIAAVVPVESPEEESYRYHLHVLDPRGADIDNAVAATLDDGLAAVECWWTEVNRERANDNRAPRARTDSNDRSVPRIAGSADVERITTPHAWYKYLDIATVRELFHRKAGRVATANQNLADQRKDRHLDLVHDRDAPEHDRGRKR